MSETAGNARRVEVKAPMSGIFYRRPAPDEPPFVEVGDTVKKKQVLTYAEFIGKGEADVEDVFERAFYVDLVNSEFKKEMKTPLDVAKLNAKEPRTLRAIEAYLAGNSFRSGTFGHYRPARYFSENIAAVWPKVSDATKDQFEAMFKQLNALLK